MEQFKGEEFKEPTQEDFEKGEEELEQMKAQGLDWKEKLGKWSKVLGLSAALTGSTLSAQAEAPTSKLADADEVKTEATYIVQNSDISPDTISYEDALNLEGGDKPSFEVATTQFGDHFENDKATLSPEALIQAQQDFYSFLDQITPENIAQVKSFVIEASADTDPTSNWDGENYKLGLARGSALVNPIHQWLADYTSETLSDAQLDALRKTPMVVKTPNYTAEGYELGTTPLEKIIDPRTGEYYDVANMTPQEIEDAKQSARYVKVSAGTYDQADQFREMLADAGKYQKVNIIVDASGSMMENNRTDMLESLRALGDNVKGGVGFGYFSNELHDSQFNMSPDMIEERLHEVKEGSKDENASYSAMQMLQQLPDIDPEKGNQVLYVSTDEDVRISPEALANLQKKAAEKNADVILLIKGPSGYAKLNLTDLPALMEKINLSPDDNRSIVIKANPNVSGHNMVLLGRSSAPAVAGANVPVEWSSN